MAVSPAFQSAKEETVRKEKIKEIYDKSHQNYGAFKIITLTSSRYPGKLIDYLKNGMKTDVETAGSGIYYYVKDTDIDTQILVSRQLDGREAGYLKSLQNRQQDSDLMKNWLTEYIGNIKDPLYAR